MLDSYILERYYGTLKICFFILEYKMASRMPYGVVLHCGTFRSAWDLIIFVCTIYVAALVPYQAVFQESGYERIEK